MAKKGLFGGLFGGKEKKDEGAKEKFEEMQKATSPEVVKAAAMKEQAERVKEMKEKPVVKKHTVVSGDTLSGIAAKYYDDAGKYMFIYEANKAVIGDNPDLIQPGMELVIPKK